MDDNVASGFIAYCRKNYKWYNECKCDKRMSPVMRLPNEKSDIMSKKGYSRPGFFGSINHYDANGKK